MKVYGQLERAQVENLTADPTGTGLVSGRVWFNSTVGEYKYYDGSATQVLADLASAQTLLLKTLTDPTFDASTIYEAIATPAAPSSGVKIYAKSDDNIYVLNSAGEEIQLGSGSGGGLDTYYSENFDRTQASDLSYGSNATFLTGSGLESAQAADETGAGRISGARSLSYTQVSGSLDDWGALPAHTLDSKQKGNTSGLTAYTTYSGDDDDMQLVLYDVNTSAVLDTVLVKASTTPLRHFLSAPVPAAATSLRVGYQVLVQNIGAKLVLDDIELSTDPYVIKDVVIEQAYEVYEGNGQGSTNIGIRRFANVANDVGSGLFSATDSATDGLEITFLQDCYVDVTYQDAETGGGGSTYGLGLNSSDLTSGWVNIPYASRLAGMSVTGGSTAAHVNHGGTSWSGYVSAGDVIRPHGASADDSTTFGIARFSIKARVSSPHLITPAKVNLTEWTSYTPTFGAGFSATSSEQFYYKRVGSDLHVRGRFTADTVAASTASIDIPSGLTIDSSTVPSASNSVVGKYFRAINSTLHGGSMHISSSSTTSINFGPSSGFSGTSSNAMDTTTGSSSFSGSDVVTLEFRVPISEWAGASTEFLAAIPFSNWTSFTPTGSWTTNTTYSGFYRRVLDTMELEITVATSGAPTSAVLTVDLPNGLTIDTTKLSNAIQYESSLGIANVRDQATATYFGMVTYETTTSVGVWVSLASGAYAEGVQVNQATPMTFASGDTVQLKFSVPISGWGV